MLLSVNSNTWIGIMVAIISNNLQLFEKFAYAELIEVGGRLRRADGLN
jgi:hypothetical protein